jgi:HK97 family phage prohead protease
MTRRDFTNMVDARSPVSSGDIERSASALVAIERKGAPIEFKFVSDGDPGLFEGYGGVFRNIDSYGDLILPGAFAASLADHKAKGTMPGMYAEHSIYTPGGDLLPIGRWLDMSEDGKGLRVKGKISALDTDHGKRIRALMLDGALGGMSIAYSVPKGGAVFGDGKKADEPRRTLRAVNLASVDIVRDPANEGARIDQVKTLLTLVDHATASKAVAAAIALHSATTVGNDSPTAEERAQLLAHLQEAHRALTGQSMPAGVKALPLTLREFEALIREMTGASNTLARAIAAHGWKALRPREEGQDQAAATAALTELADSLRGFVLPNFEDRNHVRGTG